MFWNRKKDIVLDCYTSNPFAYNLARINYGYHFIPEWWKQTPKIENISAPHEMKVGDVITAFRGKPQSIARLKPGDAYPLAHLPIGTVVYNVELQPGKGAQLVRAAGTCAQILNKTETTARLRLPSKQEKDIPLDCLATLGRVSNIDHENRVIGKAGRNRWLNRKPKGQTGINRTLWRKKRV